MNGERVRHERVDLEWQALQTMGIAHTHTQVQVQVVHPGPKSRAWRSGKLPDRGSDGALS